MTTLPVRESAPRLPALAHRPPTHPSAAAAGGMNPRELLRIVRRRKWLILIVFLVVSCLMSVATLIWWQYFPSYTAYALLVVTPPANTMLNGSSNNEFLYSKEIIERYKRSQAALVKHQEVLQEAIKLSELRKTEWYRKNETDIYEELDKEIGVAPLPETSFIQLSMSGHNKAELPGIVNSIADAFVAFSRKPARAEKQGEIDKLTAEREGKDKLRKDLQREMSVLRAGSALAAMRNQQTTVSVKLQELTHDIAKAQADYAQAAGDADSFDSEARSNALAKNAMVLQAIDMDPNYRNLMAQETQLESNLDNAVRKLGEKHRSVTSYRKLLESTKSQIEDRRKEIIKDESDKIFQMRQSEKTRAQKALADLTERLKAAKDEARDLETSIGKLDNMEKQDLDMERQMAVLDSAILERSLAIKNSPNGESSFGPVSIQAKATEPRERSAPKFKMMIPAGCFLGLVLGLGLAFLLELTDTTVKNPSDISRKMEMALLGSVPHSDDMEDEIESMYRAVLQAPYSPITEAFRQIRTNLLFSGPNESRRSLLITSPSPEEGRTTLATNLAIALAQMGRRVLLVDANFRQPALGKVFPEVASSPGLSSALVGHVEWQTAVVATEVPKLSVIPSGPLPPNPAELLGSEVMRGVIAEMVAQYDQVIFDGSPIMLVSDARVLSSLVDGVIMVVRAGGSNIGMVQRAAEQITRVGGRILGCVLQGMRVTAGGYLRKHYASFYEYHQQPEATAATAQAQVAGKALATLPAEATSTEAALTDEDLAALDEAAPPEDPTKTNENT